MKNENHKYCGKVHIYPDTQKAQFIGTVYGNSIEQIKEESRLIARIRNYGRNRLHFKCDNTGREFYIKQKLH